ncbi:MAG: UDP-N-acetylmuramoyl-tripeptide--D-alanyl-D-alanine ligase [Alphaproteobacteria bacterium]|nr:UDP-N-acetylmuramoyl-tripeptide--D-alanyl-D-alanine ligase [Alphaproteobacteria bacterium]
MTEFLWSAADILKATHGQSESVNWSVNGLSIDSRTLKKGDLFIALEGPEQDGHCFIEQAVLAGAAGVLVHQSHIKSSVPVIKVHDTQKALIELGQAGRIRSKARIVGITGSVGKTSTKEMLRLVLSARGNTHASEASFNNHWGVPFSLAKLPIKADFGIFEMGMNHPGEIDNLTRQVRPDIALITAIAPAHLAFFKDIHGITDAKAEIFHGLTRDSSAILPFDSPEYQRLLDHAKRNNVKQIISFGQSKDADIKLLNVISEKETQRITAQYYSLHIKYQLPVIGHHWAVNSLAVVATALQLGVDLKLITAALEAFYPPSGRGQKQALTISNNREILLIDDSYNANPASVQAALNVLGQTNFKATNRRIAVLGDMLELGSEAAKLHMELSQAVIQNKIDLVFTCGSFMQHLFKNLPKKIQGTHFANSALLADKIESVLDDGDIIMIKGSLGSQMKLIINKLKQLSAVRHAL